MRFAHLLCVLLVAAGGCAGPAETPPSPTPASTATGTHGTACPYTVSASVATGGQRDRTDRRVDAVDLSAPRRAEFERMVESGSVTLETLPERWSSPVLVDHRGETYYVVAQTC